MQLDPARVGESFGPRRYAYADAEVMLYALSVGADDRDLPFVYEGLGPRVYPWFALVPAARAVVEPLQALGLEPHDCLHSGQELRVLRPLPSRGEVSMESRIRNLLRKGHGSLIVLDARGWLEGAPAFEATFWVYARCPCPAGGERSRLAPIPVPARAPDLCCLATTGRTQALLHRLLGDRNPVHADPGFARARGFQRPILHGLCTLGWALRLAVRSDRSVRAEAVEEVTARFLAPVYPGQCLAMRLWKTGSDRVASLESAGGEALARIALRSSAR